MPSMDRPGIRTAQAMRSLFERYRRALQTAWDVAPNATIASTAAAMVVLLRDIDR